MEARPAAPTRHRGGTDRGGDRPLAGRDGTWGGPRRPAEFCQPFTGGGRSRHTLAALRKLAEAMERDNAETPIYRQRGKP
jgi:hypothetical protein